MNIRLLKTVNILCMAILHGVIASLYGPSLLDLAEIYNSNIEHVSYLSFTGTVAAMIGCTSASWIYRQFPSQIVIIFGVILKGTSNALVPLMPGLGGAHVVSFVLGFTMGFLETGVYVWLICLYSNTRICSAILQAFHLMFGIGSLIGSIIIRPFVTPDSNLNKTENGIISRSQGHHESQIHIAYLIAGLFSLLIAVSLTISFFIDSTPDVKTTPEVSQLECPATPNETNSFLTLFTGLHCLMFLVIFICISRYVSIYAILQGMSKDHSILIVSYFYTSFTLSRMFCTILASRTDPRLFLILVDSFILFAASSFFLFSHSSHLRLIYSLILLGAAGGPVYAAATAYLVNRLSKLNHSQTSVIKFMSNSGGLIPPLIIGPVIETKPQILPDIIFISTLLLLVIGYFLLTIKKTPQEFMKNINSRSFEAKLHLWPCSREGIKKI